MHTAGCLTAHRRSSQTLVPSLHKGTSHTILYVLYVIYAESGSHGDGCTKGHTGEQYKEDKVV